MMSVFRREPAPIPDFLGVGEWSWECERVRVSVLACMYKHARVCGCMDVCGQVRLCVRVL